MDDSTNPASKPRIVLGGHTESVGPVLLVGNSKFELNEETALSWIDTLSTFLWYRWKVVKSIAPRVTLLEPEQDG